MANTLANLARMYTETTGTGTLTLTTAVPGFNTFEDAGVTTGATITYAIYCGPHREIGAGVYTASGLTLTRATVYSSTNAGAKINLTGRSEVFITAAAEDFDSFTTDLTAHLNDTSDAHDASAISFTPAGNVAATDVQAAIAELDSEKLSTSAAAAAYQPLDADLTALAALSGTNTIYYRSAADTWSAVTVNASLGFSAGTLGGSLASNYQPLDSELTAIAGLTSAADRLPYFTGSGTAALATFTTAGRNLVDDADTTAQRTTLGLGTAATQNTGTSGATLPFLNGNNTFSGSATFTGATTLSTTLEYAAPLFLLSTADGAGESPYFLFRRQSPTPADNDRHGSIIFQGVTIDGGGSTFYSLGELASWMINGTVATLTSYLALKTYYSGAYSDRVFISGGLFMSGSIDKGTGTINAVTLYEGGTSLAAKYGALASANVWTAAQTVRINNASNTSVTVGATLSHTTSGTPGTGIGVSLAFEAETSNNNNEVGATIEAVTTDATAASEDFDLVFKTMAAGAAATEALRVKSTGALSMPVFTVANLPAGAAGYVSFASNGRKNGEGAGLGTGVLVFHDGTAWRACDTGATVAA